jgi:thiol-disulfide isomerase/thioredoxin
LTHRASAFALFLVAAFLPAAGSGSGITGELDASGLARRVAKERGHVVLVNFWATWCPPCREEFPDLSRLQRKYAGRGLRVIGVSTDIGSQMPAVEKLLADLKPSFPNYRKTTGGDDGKFIDAVDPSWGGELPFSVVFGRDGKKVMVLSGQHTYGQYEQEILKVLK